MLVIHKLDKVNQASEFDCGIVALNDFLCTQASQFIKRRESVLYGAVDMAHDGRLAGFYTLTATTMIQADDKALFKKQSPHLPIPCALIGRLAVDVRYQGIGLGADLLLHALQTVQAISGMMGLAFVVVDAKDDAAKQFYEKYGFLQISTNPRRLCLAVKSIPAN